MIAPRRSVLSRAAFGLGFAALASLSTATLGCRMQRPTPGLPASRGGTMSVRGITEFPGLYDGQGGAVSGTVQFVQRPGLFQIGRSGELLVIQSGDAAAATPVKVGDTVQAIGVVRIPSREGAWPSFGAGNGPKGQDIDWDDLAQWQGRPVFDAKMVRILDPGGAARFLAAPEAAPSSSPSDRTPTTAPATQTSGE